MRTTVDLPGDLCRGLKGRARSPLPTLVPRTGVPIAALPRTELARIEDEDDAKASTGEQPVNL